MIGLWEAWPHLPPARVLGIQIQVFTLELQGICSAYLPSFYNWYLQHLLTEVRYFPPWKYLVICLFPLYFVTPHIYMTPLFLDTVTLEVSTFQHLARRLLTFAQNRILLRKKWHIWFPNTWTDRQPMGEIRRSTEAPEHRLDLLVQSELFCSEALQRVLLYTWCIHHFWRSQLCSWTLWVPSPVSGQLFTKCTGGAWSWWKVKKEHLYCLGYIFRLQSTLRCIISIFSCVFLRTNSTTERRLSWRNRMTRLRWLRLSLSEATR